MEAADLPLDGAWRRIASLLKARLHLDVAGYKPSTIRRRIERRMTLDGFPEPAAYAEHLQRQPDALQALHDDLFVHVTQFFRDPEAFAALADQVFPALVKGRTPDDPIRVWVPGCSTGEEAYSLAVALTEWLENRRAPIAVQLFATDISEGAIAAARRAVYPESALLEVGAERLARFFTRVDGGWKVGKALRELCVFSRHDLTSNPPFARLDLISCRNVLIYFGAELQSRVFPVFHYALKPNAFLWLGQSELPGTSSKLFSVVDKVHKICVRLPSPSAARSLSASPLFAEKVRLPAVRLEAPAAKPEASRAVDDLVLERWGPPGVVIDSSHEVLQFRGDTSPFLIMPTGHPTANLFKLVRPALASKLRVVVQSAFRHNAAVRHERIPLGEPGSKRTVSIEAVPLDPRSSVRDRHVLVAFELSAAQRAERRAQVKKGSRRAGADQLVEQLQRDLDLAREQLQALSEQFESSQEELTSANEELQATNEEFQSTNEELETAKEELQAANEELISLNHELQARNAELVETNEKLRRGEDRFRLLVESVKDYAIYMLDPDGRIASWNEGARRLKGYEAAEIFGQHYSRFFTAEDRASAMPEAELEHARIEGRFEATGWRVRKDGSRFWANVVVTRVNDTRGTLVGFAKVTRDLTEKKAVEDALERSERRFRLMISNVRDYAIFMLDPDCRIASWNEGARRLKGYEANEILGRHFSAFYPPEDVAAGKCEREIATVLADGRVEDEGWRVRKDGSRFWANVVITRVNDSNGELIGFTKVTRDLTERRRAEEALRAANEGLEVRVAERTRELERALNVRDEFVSIASHELKTPLTGLKLQLQMGKRNLTAAAPPSTEQVAEMLQRCLRQAGALEDLIEDLLDVSRIQTGRFELQFSDVSVAALVEDVAARFAPQLTASHTPLELQLDRSLRAKWDQRRIGQVLANLLSNAIKYAPRAPIRITAAGADGRVRIEVADQGPGIPAEKHATIFDRFERAGAPTHVAGLGLGLFIARRIVDAHRGTVRVDSEPGKGARFIVQLPLNADGEPT